MLDREFVPKTRCEGKDRIILISLPDKEKPEPPSTFVQLGYCSTPCTVILIIIMKTAAAPPPPTPPNLELPSMSPTQQYIVTLGDFPNFRVNSPNGARWSLHPLDLVKAPDKQNPI